MSFFKISNCLICGLPWIEAIDEEEVYCSFWICDCCECEYGYDDSSKYREAWIKQGAPWFNQKARPQNWSLEEQLKHIIAVTTAMECRGGVGEYPHAGVPPLHPVPHPSEKRYIVNWNA